MLKKENSSPCHPFISGVLSNCNWEEFAFGSFPINLIKIELYFFEAVIQQCIWHKHHMSDSMNSLKVQDGKES